jgi:hypothetical protein
MMDNPQNKRSAEALKGLQAQGVIEYSIVNSGLSGLGNK